MVESTFSDKLYEKFSEKGILELYFDHEELSKIRALDYVKFINYNLANFPTIYSNRLFSVLPFLWEKNSKEDIRNMLIYLNEKDSYQGIINIISFVSKYIKIDILNFYLSLDVLNKRIQNILIEANEGVFPLLFLYKKEEEELMEVVKTTNVFTSFEKISDNLILDGFPEIESWQNYKILK